MITPLNAGHAAASFRLVAMLFGGLLPMGCSTDAKAPYHLGIVLDDDGRAGARLAAERINADGGVNGRRVELRMMEGAGSTKADIALETAAELASDTRVLAVVGHTNSSASLAASQVYNAQHVTQIAPTTSAPLYRGAGPYSFRLVGSDEHQSAFIVRHVAALRPRPRVAVLYVNDDYGRPLRGLVTAQLREQGMIPVYESPYTEVEEPTERTATVAAMARTRPDLLLWLGRTPEYALFQPSLAKLIPGVPVVGSDGFSGVLLQGDTTGVFDGVRHVRSVDVSSSDSTFQQMRTRYLKRGVGEPYDQAILSYDAVMLLAEAIRQVGPDREKIRDWVWEVGKSKPPFAGASGPIAFPSGGERAPTYFFAVYHSAARAARVRK